MRRGGPLAFASGLRGCGTTEPRRSGGLLRGSARRFGLATRIFLRGAFLNGASLSGAFLCGASIDYYESCQCVVYSATGPLIASPPGVALAFL